MPQKQLYTFSQDASTTHLLKYSMPLGRSRLPNTPPHLDSGFINEKFVFELYLLSQPPSLAPQHFSVFLHVSISSKQRYLSFCLYYLDNY